MTQASSISFAKGHGTGNDFVVLPDPDGLLSVTSTIVEALCHRRFGIGGDGVLRVVRSDRTPEGAEFGRGAPEWFMDYRNADGSMAEMCGNGIRVFARYLIESQLAEPGILNILTRGGVRTVRVGPTGDVAVDMGVVVRDGYGPEVAVHLGERTWSATGLGIPNPHAVVVLADLGVLPETLVAPKVSPPEMYPAGVNIEFAEIVEPNPSGRAHVRMRVHERGSGETLSCGTGACAVGVVVAERLGVEVETGVRVDLPGGTLLVTRRAGDRVQLDGPAELIAKGTISRRWWKEHE